ncbi:MAG: hypothetical protein MJK12_15310 [Colwellia sp.]|nr:hypothetical protein [Colwellia sp.]
MKKFNLAALPLAVAGVLASTSAFAGTEACFEVFKGDVAALITNQDTLYTPAACEATRTGLGATSLEVLDSAAVAWELTGDLDLDLNNLGAVGDERTHIIYIPTTDIPPASRITMKLSGADFGTGNANQIYLVHSDGTNHVTVASSDGAFDGTTEIEFLTKAGVTIGAGSRLLLSVNNPDVALSAALIDGISIHVGNDETCNIDPLVTIEATSAFTDAGTTIQGGKSGSDGATPILDISEQFEIVAGPQATNEILVDAEEPSIRKVFVASKDGGGDWVGQVIDTEGDTQDSTAFWEASFINHYDDLDLAVDMDADDEIIVMASADGSTGDGVTLSFLANIGAAGSVNIGDGTALDASQTDHLAVAATDDVDEVLIVDNADNVIMLTNTPTAYSILANEIFILDENTDVFVATQIVNDRTEIMEFNYQVNTTWSMDFNEPGVLLNKNGCETPTPFNVGVNGAVLKVPYTFTEANGGFVRITSEHTSEANVFMDIFDESSNEKKAVNLGLIAPKSSEVYTTDFLLGEAVAAGYVTNDFRHTMTFTVTAPKNTVHGVSVQTITGGVDRVMPVLDQNDWSQ